MRALNDRVAVVAIGPVTATAFERAGVPIATMPREPHTGELLRTVAGLVQRRRGEHTRDLTVPRFRLEPDVGVVRVGDRIETDVHGAAALGWDTALVLTGVTDVAAAAQADPAPTWIADDLAALVDQLLAERGPAASGAVTAPGRSSPPG